jgi:hypothetical protein
MARRAAFVEGQTVTTTAPGSKLPDMRFRVHKGILLVLGVVAWSGAPHASDPAVDSPGLFASETSAPKGDTKPKERPRGTMPKCPEGGERVPEKRSPYDSIAPLSPLVA